MQEQKKKRKFHFKDYLPPIIAFSIIAIVFILRFCTPEKEDKDYFVTYDNATTLVIIEYGQRSPILGYRKAFGFIAQEDYEACLNGNYQNATMTVYHPYIEGEKFTFNSDSIVSICEQTYHEFLKDYSYGTYGPK